MPVGSSPGLFIRGKCGCLRSRPVGISVTTVSIPAVAGSQALTLGRPDQRGISSFAPKLTVSIGTGNRPHASRVP